MIFKAAELNEQSTVYQNPDREIRGKLIKSKTHTKGVMETQNPLCESTFE